MSLLLHDDRRVLAAVRFRDQATQRPVSAGLAVRGGEGRWICNRSGDWVLTSAPGLEHHLREFYEAPGSPGNGSIDVSASVHDARGRYLPRSFRVELPRAASGELFEPIWVDLPPAPALALRPAWASVRVSLRFPPSEAFPEGMPVEGALVRLYRTRHGEVCRGLTDARGEALVISAGMPMFAAGESSSSVFDASVRHTVRVIADLSAIDPLTGRRSTPADPEQLWDDRSDHYDEDTGVTLSPGEELSRSFVAEWT